MKRQLYIILAFAVFLASCNKMLEVNPVASVSSDISLKDSTGVERAIIGSYSALQYVGTYGRNLAIVSDLAADNLVWTGTTQLYGQIQNKPIPADNGVIDGMWSAAYDGINRVNNILSKLPSIAYKSENGKKGVTGEALFLRALLHYNLSSYFGGVPLRLQPTVDLSNIDIEKSSKTDIYSSAISDLEAAVGLLPNANITGRANVNSAKALLARVYLAHYHESGAASSAQKAIEVATNLISNTTLSLAVNYSSLFVPTVNSSESLFEVVYDVQNFNRLAQYYYSRDLNGRYEVAPSAGLIAAFGANDARFAATIGFDEKNNAYGRKYNDVAGGTDRVYVLRLAELYLIRAEALAYTNGDIAAIQGDINAIRNRAGLLDTEANIYASLKLAIENERRLEFAFEGQRWQDLVRTSRAVEALGIDQNYTLFPIPLSEMQTNKKMKQNLGY
ncbi:MAG: RagB/SusD family nutrient uptake outer membrane protein [Bacteroidales bacterium]|nr:RagB/SusD family nutrient uptake outer membrane protein [Bacteroidales bacterium]